MIFLNVHTVNSFHTVIITPSDQTQNNKWFHWKTIYLAEILKNIHEIKYRNLYFGFLSLMENPYWGNNLQFACNALDQCFRSALQHTEVTINTAMNTV